MRGGGGGGGGIPNSAIQFMQSPSFVASYPIIYFCSSLVNLMTPLNYIESVHHQGWLAMSVQCMIRSVYTYLPQGTDVKNKDSVQFSTTKSLYGSSQVSVCCVKAL